MWSTVITEREEVSTVKREELSTVETASTVVANYGASIAKGASIAVASNGYIL